MPLDVVQSHGNIVYVRATGRLTDDDYRHFAARMEDLIDRCGPLRIVFQMQELEGWELRAAWNELAFEFRHRHDVTHVAVVGDQQWAQWVSGVSRLLTTADVRHFGLGETAEARAWIESGR